MSIWCSRGQIGTDQFPGAPKVPQRGNVLSYAIGWSNHYPSLLGPEQPSSVNIATIPVWCVPGHREENYDEYGPWVRLDVDGWEHDFNSGGETITGPLHASVILDEEAARSLVADLTAWLDAPKARPVETPHGDGYDYEEQDGE